MGELGAGGTLAHDERKTAAQKKERKTKKVFFIEIIF
jgi:hypothetical protein